MRISDWSSDVCSSDLHARIPMGDGTLSGISGGPVFAEDGHVVGVNSAATDRRGRILTTAPDAMMRLVVASRAAGERPVAYPSSEERRGGKECVQSWRFWGAPDLKKKNKTERNR